MGFRGKQIATLTLVAAVVAIATSLMNAVSLARISVAETASHGTLLAETLYHLTSGVIRDYHRDELAIALGTDQSLRDYAEGVVGYSSTTLYVAVTDEKGVALLHSNLSLSGKKLAPAESLSSFAALNPFAQLWKLSSENRVLEVAIPFHIDEEPFGAVRVAVSSVLLREELSGAVTTSAMLAAGAVLVAFLASFFLANSLLAPIEMLRRELGRINPGQGQPPLDLRNEADVSRIADFFSTMSRKIQENSLREGGSAWLETMVGGLTDAVLVVSSEGTILSMNEPAEQLLGWTRAEVQDQVLSDLVAQEHPIAELVELALETGGAVGPVSAALAINGREVTHSLTAQVLSESSELSGVMVSARDMEKLSRLGSHLSYSQKLTALGRLTSGVAHEIKNPLNAMVIHVALLRQQMVAADPASTSYLDVLDEEIRRLDRVIQGFLKFTRPEDLQLTSVDLDELLREVVRLATAEADRNGVGIEMYVPPGLPPIYGDRELLQQAFSNLVLNAVEAMPEGGTLRLKASRSADGQEIEILDTGVGIESDMLDKIFDLYVTTKTQGSGIGLSLVYRIVQLHDGDIRVVSTLGEGTRFTMHLPETTR